MKKAILTGYWELHPDAKALVIELMGHRCDFKTIQSEIQRICEIPPPSFKAIARLANYRRDASATEETRRGARPCAPTADVGQAFQPTKKASQVGAVREPPLRDLSTTGDNGNGAAKCHVHDEKTILIAPPGQRYGLDHTAGASSGACRAHHSTYTPFRLTNRLKTIAKDLPKKITRRLNRDDISNVCRHEGVTHLSSLACLARQLSDQFSHTIKTGARTADGYDAEMLTPSLMACDGCPLFLSREENHAVKTALRQAARREARAAR